MTDIKFFKNGNVFVGFVCSGHTGYDEFGKDILCASLSGMIQMTALGIKNLCGNVKITRKDNDGYIKVELPKNTAQVKLDKAQVLFDTLYLGLKDLKQGYSKYISMEVIEYVY